MLIIMRTPPTSSLASKMFSMTVSLRDESNGNIPSCPDLEFCTQTYHKISKDGDDSSNNSILMPINLFFETISPKEQKTIYDLYAFCKKAIGTLGVENRQQIEKVLQDKIDTVVRSLNLIPRLTTFCKTGVFKYPDFREIGTAPHHTKEKSYFLEDYIEVTAISVLTKMLVPIWGELIDRVDSIKITGLQREQIAFGLIEPTLENGGFERIYEKLTNTLHSTVSRNRMEADKKRSGGGGDTSYVLTHNGFDEAMLDDAVMATIIVKRLTTFNCIEGRSVDVAPDVIVVVHDSISKAADSTISNMRKETRMMPREPLRNGGDDEENTSIIDHMSKTSKKSIDVPVIVTTAAEVYEIPRMLEQYKIDMVVYEKACEYYRANSFDISPLTQAMVASFVGSRFGGSKCLSYLPPHVYQRVVVILQMYLLREGYVDITALLSSKSSMTPVEGINIALAAGIRAKLKSDEYIFCQNRFKGRLQKPAPVIGRKSNPKDIDVETIDFVTHISRMIDWLVEYSHSENMAPILWDLVPTVDRPIVGTPCRFSDDIIRDLCRFYISQIG